MLFRSCYSNRSTGHSRIPGSRPSTLEASASGAFHLSTSRCQKFHHFHLAVVDRWEMLRKRWENGPKIPWSMRGTLCPMMATLGVDANPLVLDKLRSWQHQHRRPEILPVRSPGLTSRRMRHTCFSSSRWHLRWTFLLLSAPIGWSWNSSRAIVMP